jgi:cytochrome c-type biogenesis protein CcmH/NrfF
MSKWSISAVSLVFAALACAQTATELETPAVNRVAEKLQCPCGCKMNMACRMDPYPCPVCRKNKIEIYNLEQSGKSEDQILAQFSAEQGKDILVEPPGIMGVGGIAIAAALGLGMVILVIRRLRRKPALAAPEVDAATLHALDARLDEDLDKLD